MEDKEVAIRRWGMGRNMFCARSLQLECWEGEVTHFCVKESAVRRWEGEATHEKQKGRKSRGCNHGFLRIFILEGLGLGFKLELNLEEVY